MHIQERKKKSRIFIAYMLSSSLTQELKLWKQHIQHLPVRWIAEENLHITIIPPWYEDNLQHVLGVFKTISVLPSFSLYFNHIDLGPTTKSPKLIWATAKPNPNILAVKTQLHILLSQPTELKPFHPHITLGKLFSSSARDLPAISSAFVWEEKIARIDLVESHLHPSGAQYNILASVPLQSSMVKYNKYGHTS